MQNIWLIIVVVCWNTAAFAQNTLPFDSLQGKVSYIMDIPTQDNLKPENLFDCLNLFLIKQRFLSLLYEITLPSIHVKGRCIFICLLIDKYDPYI